MIKEARIYNGEKAVFLISGVWKTRELQAREQNQITVFHHTQK